MRLTQDLHEQYIEREMRINAWLTYQENQGNSIRQVRLADLIEVTRPRGERWYVVRDLLRTKADHMSDTVINAPMVRDYGTEITRVTAECKAFAPSSLCHLWLHGDVTVYIVTQRDPDDWEQERAWAYEVLDRQEQQEREAAMNETYPRPGANHWHSDAFRFEWWRDPLAGNGSFAHTFKRASAEEVEARWQQQYPDEEDLWMEMELHWQRQEIEADRRAEEQKLAMIEAGEIGLDDLQAAASHLDRIVKEHRMSTKQDEIREDWREELTMLAEEAQHHLYDAVGILRQLADMIYEPELAHGLIPDIATRADDESEWMTKDFNLKDLIDNANKGLYDNDCPDLDEED